MSNITNLLVKRKNREDGVGSNQNAVPFNNQEFEKLRQECLESGKLFCDPTFPAEPSSLGYKELGPHVYETYNVEWKRPSELCSNPQFICDGATRGDIVQGYLGNCWLLASIASLTINTELLARVVPADQSFTDKYAGIFHFRIWHFGEWVDIIIDDRLPTVRGKLMFLHSTDGNEFWSALLEKAYAKLNTSYEAISDGSTAEGFEDFTGGISEVYELRRSNPNLFNIMRKALERGSLIGCSIYTADASETEMVTEQKLVKGHAYSVTGVEEVTVNGKKVQLVRLRNPWGHVEWTGAWSDDSSEWTQVLPVEKTKLNYSADDGEFWMAFTDFKKQYQRMEICNLTPDTLTSETVARWSYHLLDGSWKVGSTAGGCKNFADTFCSNPQYVIKLEETDDDPHDSKVGCSFLVGLMQKNMRRERKFGQKYNVIGFTIYKYKDQNNIHLGPDVLLKQGAVAMSKTFTDLHEVCGRFKLPPGEYVIVPSTYEPNQKGDFILRIFAEKHTTASPMDTSIQANLKEVKTNAVDPEIQNIFKTFAGNEIFKSNDKDNTGTMSSHGLRDALSKAGVQINSSVLDVIVLRYASQESTVDFDDFVSCLIRMELLFQMFSKFDKNNTGKIELDIQQAEHLLKLFNGSTAEGFKNFTGGISEVYKLRRSNPNLFNTMRMALKQGSLIGCSIYFKGQNNIHLGLNILLKQGAVAMSKTFTELHEVCGRFKLPPREYFIVLHMSRTKRVTSYCAFLLRNKPLPANVLAKRKDKEEGLGSNDNAIPFNNQDFKKLLQECLNSGKLFCDPTFPAESRSLGYNQLGQYSAKTTGVEWKRPTELCQNPEFIRDGATRTDICQGALGDCWLLAAIASLTLEADFLGRVVPANQSFIEKYAGIFHFQFWHYGEWVDVVIDDRLPTRNGKLLFLHSAEGNEFWSALLEKAYAKLNSSYEALTGGLTIEGFEDFTGGISESYDLQKAPPTLFNIIKKALDRGSLLGCSIDISSAVETEAVTKQKLVKGHAYSVTGAEVVHVYNNPIQLVRLRNPWGQVEWTGAWSDDSREWDQVLPEEKVKLDHSAEDGEFWMAYSDFVQHYSKLEICNLTPDTLTSEGVARWCCHQFEGTWKIGCTAGGCRNNAATFCSNPQYMIKLDETDDDPHDGIDGCSFLVGLMQKDMRKERQFGRDFNTMGFAIYKFKGQKNIYLGPEVLLRQKSVATSNFVNVREVCGRFKLPPGEYVIIPSTFEAHKNGDFILRVFAEKRAAASIMETNIKSNYTENTIPINDVDPHFQHLFKTIAGNDSEISALELQKILDRVVSQRTDLKTDGFSMETCRHIVSLLDEIFKNHDTDNSGTMSSHEIRDALGKAGFQLNTPILEVIVLRYADQQSAIDFDAFVSCLIRLELLFQMFSKFDKTNSGKIELDILQVSIFIYCHM
ncbi:Calpain-2 catalytic subunit [Bagarius yarrelli]|uniref:Calpain-2 catalytic subunit n=1 Tax=Bagarius yarrelli TaxID=175774 RepID=A0A556TTW5_BAGYA|nr:Calpain-2 catalytic subunit [Bagarius yarrelli]